MPSQVSGALMEGAFSSSDDCATHAHYDAAIRWSFGLNLFFFLLVAAQARNVNQLGCDAPRPHDWPPDPSLLPSVTQLALLPMGWDKKRRKPGPPGPLTGSQEARLRHEERKAMKAAAEKASAAQPVGREKVE